MSGPEKIAPIGRLVEKQMEIIELEDLSKQMFKEAAKMQRVCRNIDRIIWVEDFRTKLKGVLRLGF